MREIVCNPGALILALAACATSACFSTKAGYVQPSLEICNVGSFDQKLRLASDFHIDRAGDDGYDDDDVVRKVLAEDIARVDRRGVCPGTHKLGTFEMTLRRIEVGSTRSSVGKIVFWVVLLFPTLGLSSIYPLTERRWMTIELDALAKVDGKKVWSGEFTAHMGDSSLQKELPTSGAVLTALIKRAQLAAVADLKAAVRTESRIE
jgi:hypothetical protein